MFSGKFNLILMNILQNSIYSWVFQNCPGTSNVMSTNRRTYKAYIPSHHQTRVAVILPRGDALIWTKSHWTERHLPLSDMPSLNFFSYMKSKVPDTGIYILRFVAQEVSHPSNFTARLFGLVRASNKSSSKSISMFSIKCTGTVLSSSMSDER